MLWAWKAGSSGGHHMHEEKTKDDKGRGGSEEGDDSENWSLCWRRSTRGPDRLLLCSVWIRVGCAREVNFIDPREL